MAIKKINLAKFKPVLFKVPGKKDGEHSYIVKFMALNGPLEDLDSICKELKINIVDSSLTWEDYQRLYSVVSAVEIPNLLIPGRLQHAIEYVHAKFLKHPYDPKDFFWQTPDNTMVYQAHSKAPRINVPRPNHGLSHSVRVAAYNIPQLEHIKKHLNPKFISLFERYSEKKIHLLQLVALFSVVGRKDETGFHTKIPDAAKIYNQYKKNSAIALMDYLNSIKNEWSLSANEIEYYGNLLTNFGDPTIIADELKKLEELGDNQVGYKIYVFEDQQQWQARKLEIMAEIDLAVKPIIIIGTDAKSRVMYWFENGIIKREEITLKALDRDLLLQVNDANELIVNSENEIFVKNFLADFHVVNSDEPVCYTAKSTGILDYILIYKSHAADLYRCHEDIFDASMAMKFTAFCVDTVNEEKDFEKLMRLPLQLITATGDRIINNKMLDGSYSSKDYNYPTHALANTSPKFLVERINSFSTHQFDYDEIEIIQGPRPRSNATNVFNQLIKDLLNPKVSYSVVNINKEIEIHFNILGSMAPFEYYNVTKLLTYEPDFEQLSLTVDDLEAYVTYFKLNHKNKLVSNNSSNRVLMSEQDFVQRDTQDEHAHLHYGEKLAIYRYSEEDNYKSINTLLRGNYSEDELKSIKLDIVDILLVIAVASHGLSRTPLKPNKPFSEHEKVLLTRLEIPDPLLGKKRAEAIKKKSLFIQKGFFSASKYPRFVDNAAYSECINIKEPVSINPQGRGISHLARYSLEGEVVFVPNTQFVFNHSATDAVLEARPYRSVRDPQMRDYRHHILRLRSALLRFAEMLNDVVQAEGPAITLFVLALKKRVDKLDEADDAKITQICTDLYHGLHVYIEFSKSINSGAKAEILLKELKIVTAPYRQINYKKSSPTQWILPFHYAVASGNIKLVKSLLAENPNLKNTEVDGNDALLIAVYQNDRAMIIYLLNVGFEPNRTKDSDGSMVAHELYLVSDKDMFDVFIKYDAKAAYHFETAEGKQVLNHVGSYYDLTTLRKFYHDAKSDVIRVAMNIDPTLDCHFTHVLNQFFIKVMFLAIEEKNEILQEQLMARWHSANPAQTLAEYLCCKPDLSKDFFKDIFTLNHSYNDAIPNFFVELYATLSRNPNFSLLTTLLAHHPSLINSEKDNEPSALSIALEKADEKTANYLLAVGADLFRIVAGNKRAIEFVGTSDAMLMLVYIHLKQNLYKYENKLALISPSLLTQRLITQAQSDAHGAEFLVCIQAPGVRLISRINKLSDLVVAQASLAQRIPAPIWMALMLKFTEYCTELTKKGYNLKDFTLKDFHINLNDLSINLFPRARPTANANLDIEPLQNLLAQAFGLWNAEQKIVQHQSSEFINAKNWIISFSLRSQLLKILLDKSLNFTNLVSALERIEADLMGQDALVRVGFIPAADLLNDENDAFLKEVKNQGFHRIILFDDDKLRVKSVYQELCDRLIDKHGLNVYHTVVTANIKSKKILTFREMALRYSGNRRYAYFTKTCEEINYHNKQPNESKNVAKDNKITLNNSDSYNLLFCLTNVHEHNSIFHEIFLSELLLMNTVEIFYTELVSKKMNVIPYLKMILQQPFAKYHAWAQDELKTKQPSYTPILFQPAYPPTQQTTSSISCQPNSI